MGQTIQLNGGPAGMTSYAWTGPNGFTCTLQNPSIPGAAPAQAGGYFLLVTDAVGCTGQASTTVTVHAGGCLAPGASIGTLTLNGNVVLSAGSTNVFEVEGTTPANDQVTLGAAVTYGGVLKIVPAGSFTNGQTFTLFSGHGATNLSNFGSPVVVNPPVSGTSFTFTNGVLTAVVAPVGPSGPATLTNSVSGSTLTFTWPSGQGLTLKGQTNSLPTGLNPDPNAWFAVPGGIDGSNSITINPAHPSVFYRLVYP